MHLGTEEVLTKIRDPLKRELVSRSLFAAIKPSAADLTELISELAPFDLRLFSKATRILVDAEHRAKEEARRSAKSRAATPFLMVCEPGNGVNCEIALVLLRALLDSGQVKPLGVIANMWPSSERGRLLRSTLDALGMHNVPVGVGSNSGPKIQTEKSWESAESYITPRNSEREDTIIPGRKLLQMVFEEAAPASITLLCTSSLTDVALFLRDSGG